jgi:hypothetical protein
MQRDYIIKRDGKSNKISALPGVLPRRNKKRLPRRLLQAGDLFYGGAKGIRTPGLLNAIQALSQLSYSPKRTTRVL